MKKFLLGVLFGGLLLSTTAACSRCVDCKCTGNQDLEICRQAFNSRADWQDAVSAIEEGNACECSN